MVRFRRTTLIAAGCLSVLSGIVLARKFLIIPQEEWLLLGLPLLLLLKRRNMTSLIMIVALGLALGCIRGGQFMQKLSELKAVAGQQVTLEVTARSDGVYAQGSQLEFTAGGAKLVEPHSKPLAGIFRVSGFGVPMVYRGDRLLLSGKLYPTRGANQARMSYAQIEIIKPDTSRLNQFTRNFAAGLRSALPEPLSSFGLGILIGQRSSMPESLTAQLTAVGLVHIVAVSGYNLTIMVRGVSRLRLGSKYQRLALSLALIGMFVVITGFSASIVRAAIVSGLGLWAWYYGRNIRPMVVLLFAAALTGLARPFYVWGDLGWYLSFLAFFGILIIAPIVVKRFFSRPPRLLAMVVIETLAAEIMTLPLIMMIFGQLSIVALVANVIIVPLVPLAMLLAAVAGTAGMLAAPVAGWFAWPAIQLMNFMLDIIRLLASVPSALVHMSISPAFMASFYAVVLAVALVIYRRSRQKV